MHNRRAQRIREGDDLVMGPRYTAAAHDGHRFAAVQHRSEAFEVGLGRHNGVRRTVAPLGGFAGPITECNVARQHDHRHAAFLDGRAHRTLQHAWKLRRVRNQFDEVTALLEQLLRMRFLKVAEPDFRRRNMRGDGQYRLLVTVAIEQAIDQMQIAWAATAGADSELAGGGRIGTRGKRRDLLVTGMHPAYRAKLVEAVRQPVQAVASDSPDALDACSSECFCQIVRDGIPGHTLLLDDSVN
jgi:hypothetical protein